MKKSYNWSRPVDISILVGQTLTRIEGLAKRSEKVVWRTSDGKEYEMFHEQDCCETVELAEVIGDPEDLLGHPILRAEERTNSTEDPPKYADSWTSWTWTFYEISTIKGTVTLRWLGESSGYYSEDVMFKEVIN